MKTATDLLTSLTSFLLAFNMHVPAISAQIVFADYSDPDVCAGTDSDYWLTASSFQCSPGLPILHSTDLSHWTLMNYALPRLMPYEHYDTVRHGCGVWAPSIRNHDGTFYIYYGDPDFGVYMLKSTNPAVRWSDPVLVVGGKGIIDTCPLWDDDGRVYLVNAWANSRCGFNSVLTIRELSADGSRAISQPVMVYDGQPHGNHTIEGPKLYKHDGYYYILAPAGGVAAGWQLALRSRNIYGPYEEKRIYNVPGIHQGGMVDDAFICFQELQPYGRVLHRLDISWADGWPMMHERKETPAPTTTSHSALAYQWHANYQDTFGFPIVSGMRVYGYRTADCPDYRSLWNVPNLWLKKFEGQTFTDTIHTTITAKTAMQQSGFVVMGRDYLRLAFRPDTDGFVVEECRCKDADRGGTETVREIDHIPALRYEAGATPNYTCNVTFVISCASGGICTISYSTDNRHYHTLSPTFQAREGMWIGAKYGFYSITAADSRGWIDIVL
ncbi:MAG: family 43 glycosylhydrolase [Bacteroidaceae bacterium]|nr:family 43 glycosylhydrolase [Bacteroidaceae bacterium]